MNFGEARQDLNAFLPKNVPVPGGVSTWEQEETKSYPRPSSPGSQPAVDLRAS
ncbi:hypothetical protein ACPOL_5047 [Acidisarcina polymorpha]|uniref:Uncharacterized protein n=1 Tax=Acidisarcina polymorpha TaxID=2211140 RepID=A0A2Z5G6N4_9BACT|nr:hypothetical protein ACPOL_5047 [Acidisarcina polymorpha]